MQILLLILVSLCTPGVKGGEHSESQILKTLEAMQTAIVEGDSGAYMAQLTTSDACFVTEQRAWFGDFDRNPVSSFDFEPLGELQRGINGMSGVMELRVHWALESDGIERSISYLARFYPVSVDLDGPWRYAGKVWRSGGYASDEGLRVFAEPDHVELAKNVRDVAPSIEDAIEQELERTLSEPLTIKIYPAMQELQFSIAPGYLDPLSGWNEPGESIKILGRDKMSTERIKSLLAHEIGHAVSFEFGEQIIDAPWWSLEGIAELVADEYRMDSVHKREQRVAKQVAQGDRRTWDQLSDFKGEALNHTGYVYTHGWSMIRFITQRFGSHQRNDWFAAMGQGASVESATKAVLGVSFEDLDRMWEAEMISIAEQQLDD